MGLRGAVRAAAIVALLIACLPCWAVARLIGRDAFWVEFFLRVTGRILGLRIATIGQPSDGSVLFAANHVSWLDILALGGTTRARFIAKSEIAGWPLVGRLATMGGSVFVARERRSATRVQADEVAAALRQPRPVVLFAEGGTGDGRTLAPFRPALFASAAEAGVRVQPVAIDYGRRQAEIAWPDGVRFAAELRRILARRGAIAVRLHFMTPLDAGALDRKTVAARAQAAVAGALAG